MVIIQNKTEDDIFRFLNSAKSFLYIKREDSNDLYVDCV